MACPTQAITTTMGRANKNAEDFGCVAFQFRPEQHGYGYGHGHAGNEKVAINVQFTCKAQKLHFESNTGWAEVPSGILPAPTAGAVQAASAPRTSLFLVLLLFASALWLKRKICLTIKTKNNDKAHKTV